MSVVGYNVMHVYEEMRAKDALWVRRVLYRTWEQALEAAKALMQERVADMDVSPLCLLKKETQHSCDASESALIWECAEIGDAIYIVAVYAA
jgi:hypothetical protein